MARIFDVIEYPNEMRNELVHRFPESGPGDFRIGSQVIVRESQNAVFFRDGLALDVFKPGRHTIATANIPLMIEKIGSTFFSDRTPFPAEVYFVSMREFPDRKWGTPQPIIVRNPGMGLGVALLQGFGTYSFQISDAQQFVTQIVGAQGVYRTTDIENRLKTVLLSKLQDLLGETAAKQSVPELIGLTEEISAGVRAKAQDDFLALGLTLKTFYISNLKPSNKSAEELRAMGMLDMQTYTQLQAADALRDAAQNESGGAGLTAGIGAGLGIGNVMGQALGGMVGQQGAQGVQSGVAQGAAAGAGAAAGGASGSGQMPAVMTPAQAASVLQVTEADVIAAIEAGDLKARKLGQAYRISRKAMEEFLDG
jgi:excisionase family DNA binding protein